MIYAARPEEYEFPVVVDIRALFSGRDLTPAVGMSRTRFELCGCVCGWGEGGNWISDFWSTGTYTYKYCMCARRIDWTATVR